MGINIQYETVGGHIRILRNLTKTADYKYHTCSRWLSSDGSKIYEWYWTGAIDGRLYDDVIRVQSNKSCSRLLGLSAKFLINS